MLGERPKVSFRLLHPVAPGVLQACLFVLAMTALACLRLYSETHRSPARRCDRCGAGVSYLETAIEAGAEADPGTGDAEHLAMFAMIRAEYEASRRCHPLHTWAVRSLTTPQRAHRLT